MSVVVTVTVRWTESDMFADTPTARGDESSCVLCASILTSARPPHQPAERAAEKKNVPRGAETETLDTGLVEAFSLLTTGNQAQRRATLQLVALTTLSTPAGAQLWASMLEVLTIDGGGSFSSVDGFVNALINAVSAIAGAQLAASAFGA
jgi:hypothetical protein